MASSPDVMRALRAMDAQPPDAAAPDLGPLRALFAALGRAPDPDAALRDVVAALEDDAAERARVTAYAERLVAHVRVWAALADLSILPSHGLVAELRERVAAKILPSHRPPHDLIEVLRDVAGTRAAAEWITRVSDDTLSALCQVALPAGGPGRAAMAAGALRAAELVAHRLAADGEEPDLALYVEDAGDHESPFLAQAHEIVRLTAAHRAALDDTPAEAGALDAAHAFVLLAQCTDAIRRIRRRVPHTGATVRVTYAIARLEDLVERLDAVLRAFEARDEVAWPARARLLRRLVLASVESARVAPVVRRGLHLVAAEIVSHAGRAGGHYITRTLGEYARMWRAAAGAGLVVALAAVVKVGLHALHAPPVVEAGLYSLNYAAAFVAVQLLGFTIATKQPAMTAASLADAVEPRARDHASLVTTILRLSRSQIAAILGNVLVALPVAFLLSRLFQLLAGDPLASPEAADALVHALHPVESGAIPHAAITGVWLSVSGLVAGYVSNTVIARHVPARLARSRPLAERLGPARLARLARLVEERAGALTGSVVLGVLLGTTGLVGAALGLPLDIRHVSFAAANLGLGWATLGTAQVALGASLTGVALVGLTNLAVSFGLSLSLAMRARGRGLGEVPDLARRLARALVRDPGWLLPIGPTVAAEAGAPPSAGPSAADAAPALAAPRDAPRA